MMQFNIYSNLKMMIGRIISLKFLINCVCEEFPTNLAGVSSFFSLSLLLPYCNNSTIISAKYRCTCCEQLCNRCLFYKSFICFPQCRWNISRLHELIALEKLEMLSIVFTSFQWFALHKEVNVRCICAIHTDVCMALNLRYILKHSDTVKLPCITGLKRFSLINW